MDLTFNEPELAFRDELRAWLADHDPGREPDAEDANYRWRVDFQRALARDGCAVGSHVHADVHLGSGRDGPEQLVTRVGRDRRAEGSGAAVGVRRR